MNRGGDDQLLTIATYRAKKVDRDRDSVIEEPMNGEGCDDILPASQEEPARARDYGCVLGGEGYGSWG